MWFKFHFALIQILMTWSQQICCAWHNMADMWFIACTVNPKKYAHGFCFAVLCCGYTLTDFPIIIRLTSLALWQSSDCPSASKATLVNTGKCMMWIHYEWLHNHNKAKHNKTVCKFLRIYCNGGVVLLWLGFDISTLIISLICFENLASIVV